MVIWYIIFSSPKPPKKPKSKPNYLNLNSFKAQHSFDMYHFWSYSSSMKLIIFLGTFSPQITSVAFLHLNHHILYNWFLNKAKQSLEKVTLQLPHCNLDKWFICCKGMFKDLDMLLHVCIACTKSGEWFCWIICVEYIHFIGDIIL